MHPSVMEFVEREVKNRQLAGLKTLEVGSFNVNGTVRALFTGEYVGVDIREGPGVDTVIEPGKLPFPDGSFQVVVSTETLEHDPRPWLTVAEVARVLEPGGHFLVTARGYDHRGCFGVHDFPGDYYRFSVTGAEILLSDHFAEVDCQSDPTDPGFIAVAIKEKLDNTM